METISVGVNRLAEYLTAAKNLTLPSLVGKVTPCTSFLPRSPLHPDVFYATTKPLKRSILLSPSPFLPLLAPLSPVADFVATTNTRFLAMPPGGTPLGC